MGRAVDAGRADVARSWEGVEVCSKPAGALLTFAPAAMRVLKQVHPSHRICEAALRIVDCSLEVTTAQS